MTATAQYFGGSGGTGQNGVEARCPSDKRVIGGGVDAGCASAQISQSRPRNLAATGGGFLSTENPIQVIKQHFGNARLRFVDCTTAELTMNATEEGFQSSSTIALTRITAPAVGTIAACSK